MSIEYYIYCKKACESIHSKIDEILDIYDELESNNIYNKNQYIKDKNIREIELEMEQSKNFFIDKKINIECLKKLCYTKVFELCDHEFIDDLIDLTPDKSVAISYCKYCECSKYTN